ncbi:MAG: ABC transporter permease [Desulfitobacterium sp.]|nr:ABC transporter permease [Desulfitobacterium sp.]
MIGYIGKRLLHLIPILLGITLLTFGLMYLSPSDPAERLLISQGMVPDPEVLAKMRNEMGLDKPFIVQYGVWMKDILTGNMGISYMTGRPVFTELLTHLPYTVALAGSSILLTIFLAIPLGILAAVKQNKWIDYLIRLATFIGTSIPGFFLSLLLIYVFALQLKLLPVIEEQGFKSIILPTITLAIPMTSKYIRQVRAAILDELGKDYVKGARTRGVRERVILFAHVLRNALLTIITLLGISLGSLLGGTAIVETIFMWPGLGKMAIDAIGQRDYVLLQGYVIWMALIFVTVNLLTDLCYRLLDPRVKLDKEVA